MTECDLAFLFGTKLMTFGTQLFGKHRQHLEQSIRKLAERFPWRWRAPRELWWKTESVVLFSQDTDQFFPIWFAKHVFEKFIRIHFNFFVTPTDALLMILNSSDWKIAIWVSSCVVLWFMIHQFNPVFEKVWEAPITFRQAQTDTKSTPDTSRIIVGSVRTAQMPIPKLLQKPTAKYASRF